LPSVVTARTPSPPKKRRCPLASDKYPIAESETKSLVTRPGALRPLNLQCPLCGNHVLVEANFPPRVRAGSGCWFRDGANQVMRNAGGV
jgi:hypothetical protein